MQLRESHQRGFHSLAIVTEMKLLDMQLCMLKYQLHKPVHFILEDNLSDEEKQKVLQLIDEVKKLLKEFGEKYNIKNDERNLRHELSVDAVILWQDLCEYTNIQGYGPIDESIRLEYESHIERMIKLVLDIKNVCETEQN